MTIQIIAVGTEDVSALQQISRQTFFETFSASNSEENMKKFLDEGYAANKLTGEINNPDSAFYFAVFEKEVIGYLKINFGAAQTEQQHENAMEIERIYEIGRAHV